MEQSLVTYSLIRALYDEGRDYIDSFWPFTTRVLSLDKSPMNPQAVADAVADKFSLSIPVHTTRTFLERAKNRGKYVSRKDGAYALTNAGLDYVHGMETQHSVGRRITSFVKSASEYLAEKNPAFGERAYTQRIIEHIVGRGGGLFNFGVEGPVTASKSLSMEDERDVLLFFRHVKSADPEQFNTLRDLILGSTIAGLLKRTDITDATRRFKPTTLYLDTNFLLSVLGLRFPVECRPAGELIRLLNKNPRFTLGIFDFTLEEVFYLLHGFARESRKYPDGVKIGSLYASMKYRGWTTSRVTEFISRIDGELEGFGISVLTTGFRLGDISLPDEEVVNSYRGYKPMQGDRGCAHDLQAINLVAKHRPPRKARRVEDAEVFFLTEDTRLSNYAFNELGHREQETISEVMPDRLLTNLLWLKDPQVLERLPVETAIAMHSRDLFIDNAVWLRFFDVLKDLQEDGTLDDGAASVLLYSGQVHKDLAGLGAASARTAVTADFILRRLDGARKQAELEQERELKRQLQRLEGAHQQAEREQERALELRLQDLDRTKTTLSQELSEVRESIRELETRARQKDIQMAKGLKQVKGRAHRQAVWAVRLLKGLTLAGIGWLAFRYGPLIMSRWDDTGPVIELTVLALGALGVRFDPLQIWTRIRLRIEDGLIALKLRDIPISDEVGPSPIGDNIQ